METKTLPVDTLLLLADGRTVKLKNEVQIEITAARPRSGWENWDAMIAKHKPLQHVHSRYQEFSKFQSFSK